MVRVSGYGSGRMFFYAFGHFVVRGVCGRIRLASCARIGNGNCFGESNGTTNGTPLSICAMHLTFFVDPGILFAIRNANNYEIHTFTLQSTAHRNITHYSFSMRIKKLKSKKRRREKNKGNKPQTAFFFLHFCFDGAFLFFHSCFAASARWLTSHSFDLLSVCFLSVCLNRWAGSDCFCFLPSFCPESLGFFDSNYTTDT